jgi:P4 family phage/plasmid primase-like protien
VTGNVISAGEYGNRTAELQIVLDKYMKREPAPKTPTPVSSQPIHNLSDDGILAKARAAKNGAKFNALYSGDISAYPSHSEADLALCGMLAFWCRCDTAQMDRLFRGSGLYRDKWDSPRADSTYGRNVVEQTVKNCSAVYNPNSKALVPRLKPDDYTDLGQSRVFAREYGEQLRYSRATDWLVYNGVVWREAPVAAKGLTHTLTDQQLEDAHKKFMQAHEDLEKAEKAGDETMIAMAKAAMKRAEDYHKFVLSRRNSGKLSAALSVSEPMLEIDVAVLDADPFKLNTPSGTVDLRTGQFSLHDPLDYCTKITAVSPSDEGAEIFDDFLKVITCHDESLEEYLQIASGMEIIGKVYCENLEISYGGGRNGKSTYYNTKARVLGDYSGSLSAETLTQNSTKNKSPEYAELRGKRLVIAAELGVDKQLDSAIVKKLCSTDPILAEKKYKDPFSFVPAHTIVLYTNNLPKVGALDEGTWRRLIVIPFNAVIEGDADIKNYADYLFKNASGAILKWMIEGAVKFIAADCKIEPPECVKQAIDSYREANDWLSAYITERCEVDKSYTQKAGQLYNDYREYCKRNGEPTFSAAVLKDALVGAGYKHSTNNKGAFYYGLRLSQNSQPSEVPSSVVNFMPIVSPKLLGIPTPAPVRVMEGGGEIQDFSGPDSDSDIKF